MKNLLTVSAGIASAAFLTVASPAHGQASTCPVHDDLARFDYPLTRTARDIQQGKKITIVALGSSSTAGAGATSADNSYPAQLQVKLRLRFPKSNIEVINRGNNGDTAVEMMARLETQVLAMKPQMVLFQAGANTVLKSLPVEAAAKLIDETVYKIRMQDIDVVLVDHQFAPELKDRSGSQPMLDALEGISHDYGIPRMKRFELMKRWNEKDKLSFRKTVHPDGIHMNDWSYGCFADVFAQGIANTIQKPPVVAYKLR